MSSWPASDPSELCPTERLDGGMAGFEPAASRLSAGCSSQAKLHALSGLVYRTDLKVPIG